MRKRFNREEREALCSGTVEVLDGRTWHHCVIRPSQHLAIDECDTEFVALWPDTVGQGTCRIYPGHVR